MKLVWIFLAIIVGSIFLIELVLRLAFGFGDPLLYLAEDDIGYRLAPNQETRRFGNRVRIDRFSMRNDGEIAMPPLPTTLRILLIGDSIANGGWWTDQSETISARLQTRLASWYGRNRIIGTGADETPVQYPIDTIEVLNASANSWGPRNELAYLRRFGHFQADLVILLINTDDLFAPPPNSLSIGRKVTYPDRKPIAAIVEFVQRQFFPEPEFALPPEPGPVGVEEANRIAIGEIQDLLKAEGVPMVAVLTPLLREVELNHRDYEVKARQKLAEFVADRAIPLVDILPLFQARSEAPADLFRDSIHLSSLGNTIVTEEIEQAITVAISDQFLSHPAKSTP
ncbi:MAG: SGNH/GDSL hydrolase family protein [Coleofasciculaceae cyanobacterium RL_1_1]|nr:SGNH/GDSL hydrolase family protein [Coleofasciculaceae cyanobacterium RL_1_1]